MDTGLSENRSEIPFAFSIASPNHRSVTIVLYQRGFFFNVVNHYELNKLLEQSQDSELKSMLT